MDYPQYNQIMKEYDQTRMENQRILEARKSRVYATIPSYQEKEASIASYSIAQMKTALNGGLVNSHEAALMIADTRANLKQLLEENGFGADYLDPIYTCPKCKDKGYLEDNRQCSCLKQKIATTLYSHSGLFTSLDTDNFENLRLDLFEGESLSYYQNNLKMAKDFVKEFKIVYRNLFFYGTVGTGKSFLSGCIAKELMDQGHQVLYYSCCQLFDQFNLYRFDVGQIEALENHLFHCDLLILDDLAAENTSDYVKSKLFALLNTRHRKQLPTIISSNAMPAEINAIYSDRIYSRIMSQFELLKFIGPDLRMQLKLADRK